MEIAVTLETFSRNSENSISYIYQFVKHVFLNWTKPIHLFFVFNKLNKKGKSSLSIDYETLSSASWIF